MLREWRIITLNADGSQGNVVVWARHKWQAATIAVNKINARGVKVSKIVKAYTI